MISPSSSNPAATDTSTSHSAISAGCSSVSSESTSTENWKGREEPRQGESSQWPQSLPACPSKSITHPHRVVLHVDGGDVGPEKERGRAVHLHPVKIAVLLGGHR